MKEKLLKLLEFDINTAETECSYLPLANGNILFVLENTRKSIVVEQEFTPEEFEIVKTVFDLVVTGSVIGDSVKVTLDKRELAALSKLTVIQLAQDLESGLVDTGMLREDMDVVTYLKSCFLEGHDIVPAGPLKRFKVDLYHDKELKQYAGMEMVEADCMENVIVSRSWLFKQVEEDIELEQPTLFSARVTHNYTDEFNYDHKDYVKTIYVQAQSYKDGIAKLTKKHKKLWGKDTELGRVYKESKSPLDILLS